MRDRRNERDEQTGRQRVAAAVRTLFLTRSVFVLAGVLLVWLVAGKVVLALSDGDDLTAPLVFAIASLALAGAVTYLHGRWRS